MRHSPLHTTGAGWLSLLRLCAWWQIQVALPELRVTQAAVGVGGRGGRGGRATYLRIFCAGEVFQPQHHGLREKRACWDVASCGSQHCNRCSNVTIPISMTKSPNFYFSNTSRRCTKKLRWVRFGGRRRQKCLTISTEGTSPLTDTSVAAVPRPRHSLQFLRTSFQHCIPRTSPLTDSSVGAVPKDLATH